MQITLIPNRLKQIALSDRPIPYRPKREFLNKLAGLFPDLCVTGMFVYYENYWCILASSQYFTVNEPGIIGFIPMQEVIKWAPVNLSHLSVVR
jgi:hypothetical protein